MAKSNPEIKISKTENETHDAGYDNVIFADRILNFGFGPNVCRLTLGVEKPSGKYEGTTMLVIPTDTFFQALKFITSTIKNSPDLKETIKKSIDATTKTIDSF